MTTTEMHARLADKSYRPDDPRLDITPFVLVKEVSSSTGYSGYIFKNEKTGDYVVAHTGTEFDTDKGRDVFLTDAQMALRKVNQQLDDARDTVRLAMEYARRDGTQVTQIGHSLGGFFVQVLAYEYGVPGETYNAYGAAGLYGIPEGGDRVINHARVTDMVAAANAHHGEVRLYATHKDAQALLGNGPLPSEQDGRELLRDLAALNPDATHGMVQFHGGSRKLEELEIYGPNAVISDRHQILYRQHQTEFDAYRDDIRHSAQGLATLVNRTPPGWMYGNLLSGTHAGHKLLHGVTAHETHEEIRELEREAQQRIDDKNRNFVAPAEPLLRREDTRDPLRYMRDEFDARMRQWQDARCAPPGGGAPESNAGDKSPPSALREDPLAYVNRMISAFDEGDRHTFRMLTREAAADPFARQLQAQAADQVEREEQQARQLAGQQAQQQRETPHVLMRGA